MAVHNDPSQAERINELIDVMRSKLDNLSGAARSEIERGLEELRSAVAGLVHSNGVMGGIARRQQLEAVLEANEARYRELGESLSDPLSIFGPDHRLIYRNPAAEQASQIPNEKALGKTFEELYPSKVGTGMHQAFLRAAATRQVQTYLNHWVRPSDGQDCYYEINYYPGREWIVVISRDVSERENALDALRISEKFNRQLIESSIDCIKVLDLDFRLLSINSGGLRLLELERADAIIGSDWRTFWQEADQPRVQEALNAACGGLVGTFQAYCPSFKGKPMWWDVVISPIRVAGETAERLLVISRDITARVQTGETLRESEDRFRTVWEITTDAMALSDADGIVTAANPAYYQLYGYTANEVLGHSFAIIFPEEKRGWAEQQYCNVFHSDTFPEQFVSPIQRKNGEPRVVETNVAFIVKDGQRKSMLSVIRDITERTSAEDELRHTSEILRESEERFRAMADGTPVLIWVHNAEGEIEFINRAWTDYFGPTLEEVKATGWMPLVHPDDIPGYADLFEKCAQERRPFRAQARVRGKDGTWRWIDSQGQPRFSETGEFLGMAGSSIDITERTQAQAALRESEEKFAKAFHSSPVAQAITTRAEGRYIDVNDQFCRLLGYTREEVIGRTTLDFGLYQQKSERSEILTRLQLQGSLRNVERFTHNRAGEKLTVLLSFEPVEVNGEDCLLTTMIDITEQKRIAAEREVLLEEVRRQKDLLERLVEFSPIGIAMLRGPEHRFVLVNPAQRALFPTIKEFVGRTVEELWPDSTNVFKPVLDNVFQTGEPFFATDAAWVTDKGNGPEETFYSFSYTPLHTANGEIEGILVLSKETTEQVRIRQRLEAELEERKQAEEALEAAHNDLVKERNLLRAVMEALPVGLAIYDKSGGITQSNPGYEAVWGSPRPPVNSVDDYDLYKAWWMDTGVRVQPEEWASARSSTTGEPVIGQYLRIQRFDGTMGYVVNSGAPVRDANGEFIGGVVTILDITEQKRLEMERQEARMQMEVQRRLMDQREKERQGIARDIHDGPIQTLASTAFNIQFIKESFPDPTLTVELNQITLNIKSAIRELREVVNDLRPPSILRFGLPRAIMMHAEDMRERYPETTLDLTLDEDGLALSDQTCLAIFRIFQEGMNNIFRHAGAKHVWVRYETAPGEFVLEMRDDGSGFIVPKDFAHLTGSGHFGLAGMKERVEAVGGTFTITSRPDEGTTITIRGPLAGANVK